MHKHLYKIRSYTESTLISYKPIAPVNQHAARGIVISYIQVSRRFEVLIIMTENIVLWNTALYKCTEVSKECYTSTFSLSDTHDDSILLFIYRNLPRNSWILSSMCQISLIAYHAEYMNITKNDANVRVWTEKSEMNGLFGRLRHRWKMRLGERPTTYSLHLSQCLIPTVSSISSDVTSFYRLTYNRMVLLTSLHSRQNSQDWRQK